MKQELIAPAETTTFPTKANRRNKSAVDAEGLASGEEASLDPQPTIEPSRPSSKANGPVREGMFDVVLTASVMYPDLYLMIPKTYPNLVLLTLSNWPEVEPFMDSWRLKHRACFVVPVEPWMQIVGEDEPAPFVVPCCQFLAVTVRGTVPMPTYLPSQIIHGGFNGVLKTIEAMWPTARRLLVSDSIEAPSGWVKHTFTLNRRKT